jgi:thiol:disulfide interchange protein DsbD
LWKALGIVLLVAGAAELIGAAAGGHDVTQPLSGIVASGGEGKHSDELPFRMIKSVADLDRDVAAAAQAGKPVMLDFYADWCVSCKEMEKFTFSEPAVHDALAGFVLLKADVTANDETDQALMRRFGIVGPPGTMFFAGERELRALRLVGFEQADAFRARLQRAAAGGG